MIRFSTRRGAALPALLPTLALIAGIAWTAPAGAQSVERIAAVVNDVAITTSDVRERAVLGLIGSGVPVTEERVEEVSDQTLRGLVEETLRVQEARRLGIGVPEGAIDDAVNTIAQNNGATVEQLAGTFEQAGIGLGALQDQIRSEILWRGVVETRLVPEVDVTAEDIAERRAELQAAQGKPEYLLAEIFLRIDNPGEEQELRAFADDLARQMRGGARFSGLARQFSEGPESASGGDLGWVLESDLEPEIRDAVSQMVPGSLSPPVRTPFGIHLLLLRDTRAAAMAGAGDAVVDFKRVLIRPPRFTSQAQVDTWVADVQQALGNASSCGDFDRLNEAFTAEIEDTVGAVVSDLPAEQANAVADLPIGRSSQIVPSEAGIVAFMVCNRELPEGTAFDDETIEQSLIAERVRLLERRLIRDLRAAAFIDIRA